MAAAPNKGIWFGVAFLLLVWGAWAYRVQGLGGSDLLIKDPVLASPGFSYRDRTGRFVSSDELKGKVWVADFIFSTCAGSCPMLSQWMKKLGTEWKGDPDFRLVSFTVDPKRDTVEVLRKYADALEADPAQWFFLTGEKKDLFTTAREGFKVTAQEDPSGGMGFDFIHTTRLVLVDRKGMVRGYYDGQQAGDMEKLRGDIRSLLREGRRP